MQILRRRCEEAFAENSEADLVKKRLTRKLKLIRGPLDEKKDERRFMGVCCAADFLRI